METPKPLVHYYDVGKRKILCGIGGAGNRSTKYSRAISCQDCAERLDHGDADNERESSPQESETRH